MGEYELAEVLVLCDQDTGFHEAPGRPLDHPEGRDPRRPYAARHSPIKEGADNQCITALIGQETHRVQPTSGNDAVNDQMFLVGEGVGGKKDGSLDVFRAEGDPDGK